MQPRPVSVEDARQVRADAACAVVGHGERLAVTLGLVVNRARTNRIHVAPVLFRLRMHGRITVAFRRGRVQKTRAVALCQAQHVFRARRPYAQGLDGQPHVLGRTSRRGHVVDKIHRPRIEELTGAARFADIAFVKAESIFVAEVG